MKELQMTMTVTAQQFLDVVKKINEIVAFINKHFPESNEQKDKQ